jgi:glucose dehydrogenase
LPDHPFSGEALIAGPALVAALEAANIGMFSGRAALAQAEKATSKTEWLSYGGDKASSKCSPIDQIAGDNFSKLQAAWTWRSAEDSSPVSSQELENTNIILNQTLRKDLISERTCKLNCSVKFRHNR